MKTIGAQLRPHGPLLVLTFAVLAVLSGAAVGVVHGAPASQGTSISEGHLDLGVELHGGQLSIVIHDKRTGGAIPLPASEVTLIAVDESETQVPNDPQFSFLGAAGDPVWVLPQVQQDGILWLGYNTETIAAGAVDEDSVDLQLVDVAGPGRFIAFTNGSFGEPALLLNSSDGLSAEDSLALEVPIHAHINWVFTAAGAYELTFQASARINGTNVASEPTGIRFVVGQASATPSQASEATPISGEAVSPTAAKTAAAPPADASALPVGGGPPSSTDHGRSIVVIGALGLLLLIGGTGAVVAARRVRR